MMSKHWKVSKNYIFEMHRVAHGANVQTDMQLVRNHKKVRLLKIRQFQETFSFAFSNWSH